MNLLKELLSLSSKSDTIVSEGTVLNVKGKSINFEDIKATLEKAIGYLLLDIKDANERLASAGKVQRGAGKVSKSFFEDCIRINKSQMNEYKAIIKSIDKLIKLDAEYNSLDHQ